MEAGLKESRPVDLDLTDHGLIRVVVMGEHQAFTEGLALAISGEPDLTLSGVAFAPWQLRDLLATGADVALIDLESAPGGLELARELTVAFPRVRLVVMTGTLDAKLLERALAVGVSAFVTKRSSLRDVLESVRGAHGDKMAVPASLLAEVMANVGRRELHQRVVNQRRSLLTERELEILSLLAEGLSTKAIAAKLVLSNNTVRSHAQNMLTKLGAHSRLEAVAYARSTGLIDTEQRVS